MRYRLGRGWYDCVAETEAQVCGQERRPGIRGDLSQASRLRMSSQIPGRSCGQHSKGHNCTSTGNEPGRITPTPGWARRRGVAFDERYTTSVQTSEINSPAPICHPSHLIGYLHRA